MLLIKFFKSSLGTFLVILSGSILQITSLFSPIYNEALQRRTFPALRCTMSSRSIRLPITYLSSTLSSALRVSTMLNFRNSLTPGASLSVCETRLPSFGTVKLAVPSSFLFVSCFDVGFHELGVVEDMQLTSSPSLFIHSLLYGPCTTLLLVLYVSFATNFLFFVHNELENQTSSMNMFPALPSSISHPNNHFTWSS